MNSEPYKWHDDLETVSAEDCTDCKWIGRTKDSEPCAHCYFGHSAYEGRENDKGRC